MDTNETYDQMADRIETFEAFKTLTSDFAPYAGASVVDDNLTTLYEWGEANLPGGLLAFKEVGAYEIAFAQTISILKRDPNYKSQADRNTEFARDFETQTAAESRERYFNDPSFARYIDTQWETL